MSNTVNQYKAKSFENYGNAYLGTNQNTKTFCNENTTCPEFFHQVDPLSSEISYNSLFLYISIFLCSTVFLLFSPLSTAFMLCYSFCFPSLSSRLFSSVILNPYTNYFLSYRPVCHLYCSKCFLSYPSVCKPCFSVSAFSLFLLHVAYVVLTIFSFSLLCV